MLSEDEALSGVLASKELTCTVGVFSMVGSGKGLSVTKTAESLVGDAIISGEDVARETDVLDAIDGVAS